MEKPLTRPPNPKRRHFLQAFVATFGAIWGVLMLYPLYRYLRPPKNMLAESDVSSVSLGSAGNLPVGAGKNFQFGSIPGVIIHTPDDQFHAFDAICTHLGCTVQYRPDLQRIWCACHGGQYDAETGKNIAGPPPRPLTPLKATVENGNIIVSKP
jgi:cytochrome b6-f complex iron-sulfur subunit